MKRISKALMVLFCVVLAGNAMAIEEAQYDVITAEKPFEVRNYTTAVVAEVVLKGEFDSVSNKAFRKLFKFISGDNKSRSKIAMTAPVSQASTSEKIAMTAPVSQQETDQGWSVSFMMPASYTMQTTPQPDDVDVVLREIPAYSAAVIRYSGSWKQKKYDAKLKLLEDWIKTKGLKPLGPPVFARYNAPVTPWFMRRNEIVIPVANPG